MIVADMVTSNIINNNNEGVHNTPMTRFAIKIFTGSFYYSSQLRLLKDGTYSGRAVLYGVVFY